MNNSNDFELPREDHLDDWIKCTPEQILEWLYQANRFVQAFRITKDDIAKSNEKKL